jgi:hypothetical protein
VNKVSKLEAGQAARLNGYLVTCMRMRSGGYRYHVQIEDHGWLLPICVCKSLDQVNQLIGGKR